MLEAFAEYLFAAGLWSKPGHRDMPHVLYTAHDKYITVTRHDRLRRYEWQSWLNHTDG